MKSKEYEKLVSGIVERMREASPKLANSILNYGIHNKIKGISGFEHQIDVSLEADNCLYLIECKYWGDKVDVEPVLVLITRLCDIQIRKQQKFPDFTCKGIIASTKDITKGARQVADYYGIQIEIVRSATEFGMKIDDLISIGYESKGVVSDRAKTTVIPPD